MKIIFFESSREAWGTEQHFIALAAGMAREGHQVRVLIRQGSLMEPILRASGLSVHAVKFGGGGDPRLLKRVFQLIREDRPDWLVANDAKFYWPLVILGKLTGIRVALFRHLDFIKKRLTRYFVPRLADRFFVVSRYMLEAFVRSGIPRQRLSLLYNPVNTGSFKPSEEKRVQLRSMHRVSDEEILVGFLGRVISEKGALVMCDAITKAMILRTSLHMLWVGEGGAIAEIRARIRSDHSARHHFIGWTQDMPQIYPALDIVVMPSVMPETFGRVSAEAQACGVPVICSDAGGLPETFLSNISGLSVSAGDVDVLCDRIVDLADNPEQRRQMGISGQAFVDATFSTRIVCKQFEQLLEDASLRLPDVAESWEFPRGKSS